MTSAFQHLARLTLFVILVFHFFLFKLRKKTIQKRFAKVFLLGVAFLPDFFLNVLVMTNTKCSVPSKE